MPGILAVMKECSQLLLSLKPLFLQILKTASKFYFRSVQACRSSVLRIVGFDLPQSFGSFRFLVPRLFPPAELHGG